MKQEQDADAIKNASILEHDRAEPTRQGFRQSRCDFRTNVEVLEIDVGDLQLARERAADLLFGDIPGIDENAAELAPAALLFIECGFELVLRQQLLLQKNLA